MNEVYEDLNKLRDLRNQLSDNYIWVNSNSYNQVEIIHHIILLLSVDILIGKDSYSTDIWIINQWYFMKI